MARHRRFRPSRRAYVPSTSAAGFAGDYGSIAELIDNYRTVRNPQNQWHVADCERGSGADWFGAGCADGADVRRIMRDGWPEGRARLDALRAKIAAPDAPPVDRRRRITRGAAGDALDIHAVYAGRLDCAWSAARRQALHAPQRVDILGSMLISSASDADQLFWRGAAMVALCDVLESAGYIVRLVAGQASTTCAAHEPYSVRVTLKDYDRPLDVATVSATLMPGFSRHCLFTWVAANATQPCGPGLQYVVDMQPRPDEIYCGLAVKCEATALAWISEQVARINAGATAAA